MLKHFATFMLASALSIGAWTSLAAHDNFGGDEHSDNLLYDRQQRDQNQADWQTGVNPETDYNYQQRHYPSERGRDFRYRSPDYDNNYDNSGYNNYRR